MLPVVPIPHLKLAVRTLAVVRAVLPVAQKLVAAAEVLEAVVTVKLTVAEAD